MRRLRDLARARGVPLLMGVLNCTPDSFSDGGLYVDERLALDHAVRLVERGADLVDLGAESTRPGSAKIEPSAQIARFGRLFEALRERAIPTSVDTTSPEVAAFAAERGARLINSVELEPAEALAQIAKRHNVALALMHSEGPMSTMRGFGQSGGDPDSILERVQRRWCEARDRARRVGLSDEDIFFDPGFGFHKSADESLALLKRLDHFIALGHPILIGPSRKSFLAEHSSQKGPKPSPTERLGATVAACLHGRSRGADVLRVHDVFEVRQALEVARVLDVSEPVKFRDRAVSEGESAPGAATHPPKRGEGVRA